MHKILNVKSKGLVQVVRVPGDKSITHRSIMFGALATGVSEVRTEALGRDNFATIRIFQQLGVDINLQLNAEMFLIAKSEGIANCVMTDDAECVLRLTSEGHSSFKAPSYPLDCGNSGTTARLLTGILASCEDKQFTLVGDESLSKRPFQRVTKPLSEMGAVFDGEFLPLTITGSHLHSLVCKLPKPSAQVKSAILLAGLFADGKTQVKESLCSRNHTERMLEAMGVGLRETITDDGYEVEVIGDRARKLKPFQMRIPGDISSAMFFIVAGLLTADQSTCIENIGLNPTRTGPLDILKRMGSKFAIQNVRDENGEAVGDVLIEGVSSLKGIDIGAEDVSRSIDEIPIICVAAAFAEGVTRIRGAEELRVKESDRLSMTVALLRSYGVSVQEHKDGLDITGGVPPSTLLQYEPWKSCHDHRISMCGAILEFLLFREMAISDLASIETSFPTFLKNFQ